MTSEALPDALDAIWRAHPKDRLRVAVAAVPLLAPSEIDALTAWDFDASFTATAVGQLVSEQPSHAANIITYSDTPMHRVGTEATLTSTSHTISSLLLVAQYVRDRYDTDSLVPFEQREARWEDLCEEVGIDMCRLRRLLRSYDRFLGVSA